MSASSMKSSFLLELREDLETFAGNFDDLMGRVENQGHLRTFSRGQLGTVERKALEPIAELEDVNPRLLQFFFSKYKWDEDGVRDRIQKMVADKYGSDDGIFIIDETSDSKKGLWTAGIQRQYCGESGKTDNCIVSVHLAYRNKGFHCLLDSDLYMPKSWDCDTGDDNIEERRERASVPDDVGYESKAKLSVAQLRRAMGNGVEGKYVAADEGYGSKPWWRDELGELGKTYVVEVPKNTRGWLRRPTPGNKGRKHKKGCHEKLVYSSAKGPLKVENLVSSPHGLRFTKWEHYIVKNTTKGPEIWRFKRHTFYESRRQNRVGKAQRLIVAVNILTNQIKYFLSNAPSNAKLSKLVAVAFSRYWVERCFQDCKSQLGLNHAEIRSYIGLKRHFILTMANYYFIQDWRHHREWPDYDTTPTVNQLANAVQKLIDFEVEAALDIPIELVPQAVKNRAARHAKRIINTQAKNAKARKSHTKKRLRLLEEEHGILIDPPDLPMDADLPKLIHVT